MFNPKQDYGTVVGDHVTAGYFVQNGKTYKPNGVEVDPATGEPLAVDPMAKARAAKAAKKAGVPEDSVLAQLRD